MYVVPFIEMSYIRSIIRNQIGYQLHASNYSLHNLSYVMNHNETFLEFCYCIYYTHLHKNVWTDVYLRKQSAECCVFLESY